jgi:hypothetical protein
MNVREVINKVYVAIVEEHGVDGKEIKFKEPLSAFIESHRGDYSYSSFHGLHENAHLIEVNGNPWLVSQMIPGSRYSRQTHVTLGGEPYGDITAIEAPYGETGTKELKKEFKWHLDNSTFSQFVVYGTEGGELKASFPFHDIMKHLAKLDLTKFVHIYLDRGYDNIPEKFPPGMSYGYPVHFNGGIVGALQEAVEKTLGDENYRVIAIK